MAAWFLVVLLFIATGENYIIKYYNSKYTFQFIHPYIFMESFITSAYSQVL